MATTTISGEGGRGFTEANHMEFKVDASSSYATGQEEWPTPIKSMLYTREVRPKPPRRDALTIERANLLNMFKLIIKELIDSSMSQGRMLDNDHTPLQQFFVVLEHVLRHGLKPKKGILRDKREFWCILECVENLTSEASEITMSVRDMPNIKTSLGRARAFLRLALMQKRLADYFRLLIDRKDQILSDFYDPGAILMEDEGTVIAGLLVGLNVIDCNLCIKEEDLDQPMGVIDFSLYLRDRDKSALTSPESESGDGGSQMATILDQKNYLEELNRHLNATVTNLQQKLETFTTTNALMKEDLAIAKNTILNIQEERNALEMERNTLSEEHVKEIEIARQDISTERQTYETSRAGLDSMYSDVKRSLEEETQLRLDIEKELELQIGMKQEMEVALRLLEKDIHEKQDTIISLRKQLDDIKAINLDMYNKLQSCESSLKYKSELVIKLEEKGQQLISTLRDLETKLSQSIVEKQAAEETARKLGQVIADKDNKGSALETDLRIEREWRGTLQQSLEHEKQRLHQVQQEFQRARGVQQDYDTLQKQHGTLQERCDEHERALSELGAHLSESKLKVEDMREAQQVVVEAQWASDKEANNCYTCTKTFSVSRRKHHCRNCGGIFCNECSDNKMPHASSSKPVRVCDQCYAVLLQRCSVK